MVQRDFKKARAAALRELEYLLGVRQQTEQQILHLRNVIAALDALSDGTPKKPAQMPRLTDAIRSIFKAAKENEWFSARDIRSGLLAMGFQDSHYSNFLASIHVILRRLEKNEELESENHAFRRKEKNEDWLADV